MRKTQLLSTAAAALLLTAGVAFAQAPKDENKAAPAQAPAAQKNAPAEKVAPAMKPGAQKAPAEKSAQRPTHETTGQAPKADEMKKDNAPAAKPEPKSNNDAHGGMRSENEKSNPKANEKNASEQKGGMKNNAAQASPNAASPKATTGQGAASGAAKLSTQQRTKISAVFKQHRVQPAKINVSIRVGARVPTSVHFYPVPVEVVDIYPEWRGYDYILVGDQILILDPRSHEIIAILEA